MKLLFADVAESTVQMKGKKKGGKGKAAAGAHFNKVMKRANIFQAKIAPNGAKIFLKDGGQALKTGGNLKAQLPGKGSAAGLEVLLATPQNALNLVELNEKARVLLKKGVRAEKLPALGEKLAKLNQLMEDLGSGKSGEEGESLLARLQGLLKEKGRNKDKLPDLEKPEGKDRKDLLVALGLNTDVEAKKGKGIKGLVREEALTRDGKLAAKSDKKGIISHTKPEEKAPANPHEAALKAMAKGAVVKETGARESVAKEALASEAVIRETLVKGNAVKIGDVSDQKGDKAASGVHVKKAVSPLPPGMKPANEEIPPELMDKVLKESGTRKIGKDNEAPPIHGSEGKSDKAQNLTVRGKGVRLNEGEVVELTRKWTALKKTPVQESQAAQAVKQSAAPATPMMEAPDKASVLQQPLVAETFKTRNTKGGKGGKDADESTLKKAQKTRGKAQAQAHGKAVQSAPTPDSQKVPLAETRVESAVTSPEALVEEILSGKTGKGPKSESNGNFRDILKTATATAGPEQATQVKATATASDVKPPPQPMFNQVADGIRQAYILTPRSVTVKLTPDDLGEIKVKVAIENEQLRAQIQTESQKVAAIIKDHQGDLEHRLREQGIEFERFDVKEEPQQFGDRRGSGKKGMNGEGQPGGPGGEEAVDDESKAAEAEVEQTHQAVQSTVEDGAPLNITI